MSASHTSSGRPAQACRRDFALGLSLLTLLLVALDTRAALPSIRYLPVAFGAYDGSPTGLAVYNDGPGAVAIDVTLGPSRVFVEGEEDVWWFPRAGGRHHLKMYPTSGPCADPMQLEGNIYDLDLDFEAGKLHTAEFYCVDLTKPYDPAPVWSLVLVLDDGSRTEGALPNHLIRPD